jgi:uncharacterized protein
VPSQSPKASTIASRGSASAWKDASWFVAVTFMFSWVPWFVLLFTTGDPLAGPASIALWVAGGYGPPLAAVVVVAAGSGRAGLRRLFRGLLAWRLGAWYLVLLIPLPIIVAGVLLTVASGQATLELAAPFHWLLLPAMMLGGILLGGFEEIGWRGYLLPRLQDRVGALTASLIIGVVWAAWHAPLLVLGSTAQASFSPVWFTLQIVATSVLLTWMYNGTGGSLLLVVLYHAADNGWYDAVVTGLAPESLGGALGPVAVLLTLIAAWLVVRHGPADLATRPRQGWHERPTDESRSTAVA